MKYYHAFNKLPSYDWSNTDLTLYDVWQVRDDVRLVANSKEFHIQSMNNVKLVANNVIQFEYNVGLREPLKDIHHAYIRNMQFT